MCANLNHNHDNIGILAIDLNTDTSNKYPTTNKCDAKLGIPVPGPNSNGITHDNFHITFKEKDLQIFCEGKGKRLKVLNFVYLTTIFTLHLKMCELS